MNNKNEQYISYDKLRSLVQIENIDEKDFDSICKTFYEEEEIKKYIPNGILQIDPRTNDKIVYNSSRAKRPHDNRPVENLKENNSFKKCIICEGKTTGILDIAKLSKGYTFINKNLYPIVYPIKINSLFKNITEEPIYKNSFGDPYGLHFLQWTSSYHSKDWNNMPINDLAIVIKRLAILEKKLLYSENINISDNEYWGEKYHTRGFVVVVKNYGRLVGGSLEHGHQQIAYTNIMPKKYVDNLNFELKRNEKYSDYILRENPLDLSIKKYKTAVLLVPYFMKRPYDMQLILKDTDKRYLFQLSEDEIRDVARGWHDAINSIIKIMKDIGKEVAYNVIMHNGPGAGLYFEFFPYTQEVGGFEYLGLYLCQGNPFDVFKIIKENINSKQDV